MKVENILQSKGSDIFHVSSKAKITEAVDVLSDKNIGAVAVMDGASQLVGILSERDIVRRLAKHGTDAVSLSVEDCMTRNLITCSPADEVNTVMELMTEKRIRHMPVLDTGTMVGMISIGDVVKRKIEQAEREAESLRDYISA